MKRLKPRQLANRTGLLLLATIVFGFLSGCASSYRPIMADRHTYPGVAENDLLELKYEYDVLMKAGNKKYAGKEEARNIRLVAVQFTNLSSRTVTFPDDVEILAGDQRVTVLQPDEASRKLKQIAPLYMLWSVLWVVVSKCDEQDCTSIPIPVGALIGLGNTIKAGNANKNLLMDLMHYNILNKVVAPGETVTGIISIAVNSGQPLEIRMKE